MFPVTLLQLVAGGVVQSELCATSMGYHVARPNNGGFYVAYATGYPALNRILYGARDPDAACLEPV